MSRGQDIVADVLANEQLGGRTLLDGELLRQGTDADNVRVHRDRDLAADTALTNVLLGTTAGSRQALAANTLIVSNLAANGDIGVYVNNGGVSYEALLVDASAQLVYLGWGGSFSAAVGSGHELRLYETNNGNHVGFKAGTLSADTVWTLPIADGTANQILVTNGSKVLSWATGLSTGNMADGTSAAPGLPFGTDTDTGFYLSAANILGIAAGGVAEITISRPTDITDSVVTVLSTKASTSTTVGALVVAGGGAFGGALYTGGGVFIGGGTNAFSTLGLTISQGANGDAILTFKSSDIAHSFTTLADANTFGYVNKVSDIRGGLFIGGFAETGQAYQGLFLQGAITDAAATTHTAAGYGIITARAAILSGTTVGAVGANGNLFSVGNLNTTAFIVDAEGDLFADGTLAAYDTEDDVALSRAFDLNRGARGLIESKWDSYVKYNEKSLVDMGLMGAPKSEGGLINYTLLARLHNGALWQIFTDIMEIAGVLSPEQQARLPERIQSKLLPAGGS